MDRKSLSPGKMKQRLAIIGSGIAGLGAAWYLKDHYEITLFEKNNYPGGHSNTIDIANDPGVSFDTGFMVFNHETYPLLTKLFEDLNVVTHPTSMSFSVQNIPARLEYCGSGWNGLFGQRRNLIKADFWKLLSEINKFNTESKRYLAEENSAITIKDFCDELKLSNNFLFNYLVPMSSAVWSTPPDQMLDFPAGTLIRFFYNHGFLGMNTQHQWYTVDGGSRAYVQRLLEISKPQIFLNTAISKVYRNNNKVFIEKNSGDKEIFDKCIIATHADQSLKLADDLNVDEKKLLGNFNYQRNIATIHSDNNVMPIRNRIWSSWNYRIDKKANHISNSTIYWMNNLQKIKSNRNYFVSIDEAGSVDRQSIIKEIEYEHPLFSSGAIAAQDSLHKLNRDNLYFCGSYHRYGFHEDALMSAKNIATKILSTN